MNLREHLSLSLALFEHSTQTMQQVGVREVIYIFLLFVVGLFTCEWNQVKTDALSSQRRNSQMLRRMGTKM